MAAVIRPLVQADPRYPANNGGRSGVDWTALRGDARRSMPSTTTSIHFRFGRFELQPEERRLLADGAPVQVGPHAFDLLVALVERGGSLITKEELLQRVWPRVIVEENTLQVHVSALRKILGPDAIATVSGRGYRFALEVASAGGDLAPPRHNLPHQLTRFIGREKEIAELEQSLGTTRLLTITGAGGCGKTRLAMQFVERVAGRFLDGAWCVELAAVADDDLVPRSVAKALGIREQGGASLTPALAGYLHARNLLLVLDNAEHLLDACAELVYGLLRQCPRLVVLVTSRERLGVAGELTYRVPSLSVPDPDRDATPEGITACESARLFIDRARLLEPSFAITPQNAPALASICRRLDGIALAIELAATRVRILSLEEYEWRLHKRFDLLTGGSRTALPRHRTMRSVINWSYDMLGDAERATLRRLSVFSGGWTLDAAEHVCVGYDVDASRVLDVLTTLADKNLVLAEKRGGTTRYGLLETVRDYAQDLLREDGEADRVRRRHLAYYLALAEEADRQAGDMCGRKAWVDRLEEEYDNVRAALAFSSSDGGDAASGLRLAGALCGFWVQRGYFDEGRKWCSVLLAADPGGQDADARAKLLRASDMMAQERQ